MSFISENPVGVFYEHPFEYNLLVTELNTRKVPVVQISPSTHDFSPGAVEIPYSLIFNDLSSPIGFQRDPKALQQRINFTRHLELNDLRFAQGRIVNGSVAIETLSNRARQLSVFSSLNLPFPKTRIVNSLDKLISILPEFVFPVLVKPNDTWKTLPVLRFETLSALVDAIVKNQLPFENDLLLVQEYHKPKGDNIVRVDTINGRVVTAQKIHTIREPLPLWPVEHRAEYFQPSEEIVQAVESIIRTARIDVGAVEYFVDQKSNNAIFYSIRPHSNSRAAESAAARLSILADYFEKRISKIRELELAI
jgi:glutathione synthase/RimK-type ligase-like ATP-grasp enzyme